MITVLLHCTCFRCYWGHFDPRGSFGLRDVMEAEIKKLLDRPEIWYAGVFEVANHEYGNRFVPLYIV